MVIMFIVSTHKATQPFSFLTKSLCMQGPIFAIIGAWLIYQNQNKDVIAKDLSDRMFQKAIITTGLSFILSHFGPIDDW